MQNKNEMSRRKAWLILLVSLLDDAALVALIFLVLWFFHVKITWVIIVATGLAVAFFFLVMHRAVIPGLRRRKVTGAEGMIGQEGEVTEPLKQGGVVRIKGEYWQARSVEGEMKVGATVEVVGIKGLVLEVKGRK